MKVLLLLVSMLIIIRFVVVRKKKMEEQYTQQENPNALLALNNEVTGVVTGCHHWMEGLLPVQSIFSLLDHANELFREEFIDTHFLPMIYGCMASKFQVSTVQEKKCTVKVHSACGKLQHVSETSEALTVTSGRPKKKIKGESAGGGSEKGEVTKQGMSVILKFSVTVEGGMKTGILAIPLISFVQRQGTHLNFLQLNFSARETVPIKIVITPNVDAYERFSKGECGAVDIVENVDNLLYVGEKVSEDGTCSFAWPEHILCGLPTKEAILSMVFHDENATIKLKDVFVKMTYYY